MRLLPRALLSILAGLCVMGSNWIFIPSASTLTWPIDGIKFLYDATSNAAGNMTLAGSKISTLKDLSGNAYHLSNGTDATRPLYAAASDGAHGSVACDRTISSVLFNSQALVSTAAAHTVGIRYKIDSYGPSSRAVIATVGSSVDTYFLVHQSGNVFAGGSSGDWNFGIKSSTEVSDGSWHYRIWTYNGAGATDAANYTMYLDGVLQTAVSADVSGWNLGGITTAVCGYYDGPDTDNFGSGNVSKFGGWGALSDPDIAQLNAWLAD